MKSRVRQHIRSNVVGYVGVFLALTSTAVALPGTATVQSNDIKPNAVRASHIKDGQIRGADVADNSLTGADIDEDSLSIQGGGAPTGPAGGDLAGAFPNPSIAPNAIDSAEVADGALVGADIGNGGLTGLDIQEESVGGNDLNDDSVTTFDLKDGTVFARDVAPNSLTGDLIQEPTLDLPASPAVAPSGSCNPGATGDFARCLIRRIEFAGAGFDQAVVIAAVTWHTDGGGGRGNCQLRIGDAVMDQAAIGELSNTTAADRTHETTLIGMPSGSAGIEADLSVHCNETEADMRYPDIRLAALGDVAPAG